MSDKVRVLVASAIPLNVGSASLTRLSRLSEAVAPYGISFTLCGSYPLGKEWATMIIRGLETICFDEILSSRFGISLGRRRNLNAISFYEKNLSAILKDNKIDICILYTEMGDLSMTVLDICRSVGVKVMADMVEWHAAWLRNLVNGVWFYQSIHLNYVCPRLDGVIAISPFWCEWATAKELPSVYVPAISPRSSLLSDRPRLRQPGDLFKLVFVGSWVARECVDAILDGVGACLRKGANVELHLVGTDGASMWERATRRSVFRAQAMGWAKVHGRVPDAELHDLLTAADSFILLRRPGRETAALFPTRLAEYLAYAKPVILSNTSPFSCCFTHGKDAFLVSSDLSPRSVSDAIIQIASDTCLAKTLSLGAAEAARSRHSSADSGRRLAAFIQSLMRKRDNSLIT